MRATIPGKQEGPALLPTLPEYGARSWTRTNDPLINNKPAIVAQTIVWLRFCAQQSPNRVARIFNQRFDFGRADQLAKLTQS